MNKKQRQEVLKRCSNPGWLGSSVFVIAVPVAGSSGIALGFADRDLVYTSTAVGMGQANLSPHTDTHDQTTQMRVSKVKWRRLIIYIPTRAIVTALEPLP